jgi:hypothetical protein
VGVATISLPHDLVDDELRVTTDVKLLNNELGGDALAVDGCLVFHHIGCAEVQSNHVKEPVSLCGDQHYAFSAPLRVKESSKYMLQCSWVTGGGEGGGTAMYRSIRPRNPPEPGT